jgi:hypothetical protein
MTDIVTVPEGDFTPGAQAALQNTVQLINASWNGGEDLRTDMAAKVVETQTYLAGAVIADITADVIAADAVTEPTVDIPATQDAGEVMALFDAKYAELVAMLAAKFVEFRAEYFPTEQALYDKAELWISEALDNPTGGMPAAVQAQLIEDGRTRALNDSSRATNAVLAKFAGLRFPLPPGAAAAAAVDIQKQAQQEIAKAGRDLTKESIEMMKFAIEKAMGTRKLAMDSAIDYIKALVSAPQIASQLVGVGYDAQSKLIAAAASYYNARTNAKQLMVDKDKFNTTSKLSADEKNQAADKVLVDKNVEVLQVACQQLAQMATALYNNLHVEAGTRYAVDYSGSE